MPKTLTIRLTPADVKLISALRRAAVTATGNDFTTKSDIIRFALGAAAQTCGEAAA